MDLSERRSGDSHGVATADGSTTEVFSQLLDGLNSAVTSWFATRAAPSELTPLSVRALRVLDAHGEATLSGIGQPLGVPPSSMTGIATRLVQLGLAERTRSQQDRRSVVLRITPSGRDTIGELTERMDADIGAILETIDPERLDHLLTDIAVVTERIRDLAEPGAAQDGAGPQGDGLSDGVNPDGVNSDGVNSDGVSPDHLLDGPTSDGSRA